MATADRKATTEPGQDHREWRLDRPLDTGECIFYAYCEIGTFLTVQHVTLTEPFDEMTVREAAASVQRRHPVLGARVVLEAGVPRWRTPVDSGPAPLIVVRSGASVMDLVEQELHRPFDLSSAPPWRCLVVPPRTPGGPMDLLVSCSHAAADGRSASVVLMDLVAACVAIRSGLPLPPPRPPAPTLDDVLPWPGLRAMIGHRVRRLVARMRPAEPMMGGDAGSRRKIKRFSRVARGTLPPPALEALLRRARAEHTTLTGALSAGLLGALHGLHVPGPTVTISHAVSLREVARPPIAPEDVGCFASVVPTRQNLASSRPFWPLARDVVGEVRRILRRGDITAGIQASRGKYRKIAEAASRMASAPGSSGRIGSVTLSNRGRVPERSLGSLRLEGWFSATSNHNVGNELQLSTGTMGGTLSCALVYVEPLISGALAEGVLGTMMEILTSAPFL